MRTIYLDYCSTTPCAGSVREAMLPYFCEHFADPNSRHWMGRVAQEAIEDARGALATLLNCHPTEIFFTSGGTESINLGILGAAAEMEGHEPKSSIPHLIVSAIEHPCVSKCAEILQRQGWRVTRIGCDTHGVIKLDHLENAIRDETRLISIMHVNHEIGTIQPIREIRELCEGKRIILHTDACQSVGKLNCDVEHLGIDLLSLSGHKMYAPKGVGALYVRSGLPIQPILCGEYQECGIRPGMENVPCIAGLGQAVRLAIDGNSDIYDRLAMLTDRFLERVDSILGHRILVHGRKALRIPGIVSLEFCGKPAEQVLACCPEICAGPTGHDGHASSYLGMATTLAAMGVTPNSADSTVRLSFGWNTTEEDVDRAAEILAHAYDMA